MSKRHDPTGRTYTYAGIMVSRAGEEVLVLGPGDETTIPVKFTRDGAVMGVNPRSLQ